MMSSDEVKQAYGEDKKFKDYDRFIDGLKSVDSSEFTQIKTILFILLFIQWHNKALNLVSCKKKRDFSDLLNMIDQFSK